jgi:molecular chaperone DnaJ
MTSDTTCPLCSGLGAFTAPRLRPCPRCHGSGVLTGDFVPHAGPTTGRMLPWKQPCPACQGTGEKAGPSVVICAMCHGTGRVPAETLVRPLR